jgi:hypothetical protein
MFSSNITYCAGLVARPSQRAIDSGAIRGPGLVDVELASCIAAYAARVAAEAIPPPLPSE